ncbi:hypothetical protein G6N05_09935 [Flavobacterium sp. F372]|uniref:Uncharacterized protein n=1 Tax=Flavobacterium bernardetii TaxID=2813823 RepID=A0ABR7IYC1_9FLAO|nr:hypothetical protein [Flavobacterium bernardetii]MBC5834778.1 hypothetical protein [Flavobacterium bernardetii]NHF70426.1 hypothetical protein [Flavobacterium bernardetii]
MEIKLKNGIDRLEFGMTPKYVEALYGKPSKTFKDDEDNTIYVYNKERMKLTFYVEEDLKLGYISTSNPEITLFGSKVISTPWDVVNGDLAINKITDFEKDSEEGVDSYFNEANWLFLQVDYDEVVEIEIGAIINDNDEFEWKFKG